MRTAREMREAAKRLRDLCDIWSDDHYGFIQLNIGEAEAVMVMLRTAADEMERMRAALVSIRAIAETHGPLTTDTVPGILMIARTILGTEEPHE